eukprot:gene10346-34901_t
MPGVRRGKGAKGKPPAAEAPKAAAGAVREEQPVLGVVRVDQRHVRALRHNVLALRRVLRQYLQRLDQLRQRQEGSSAGKKGGGRAAAAKGGAAEGQPCGAEEWE